MYNYLTISQCYFTRNLNFVYTLNQLKIYIKKLPTN